MCRFFYLLTTLTIYQAHAILILILHQKETHIYIYASLSRTSTLT